MGVLDAAFLCSQGESRGDQLVGVAILEQKGFCKVEPVVENGRRGEAGETIALGICHGASAVGAVIRMAGQSEQVGARSRDSGGLGYGDGTTNGTAGRGLEQLLGAVCGIQEIRRRVG